MPFQASDRLPAERASKLAHLDVLKSPLVTALCESFEDSQITQPMLPTMWMPLPPKQTPLSLIFGVDGSVQVIESESKPHKALGFVKTAMITLDGPALATLDKYDPHPFAIRDILERSQLYHATVFPLRNVNVSGKTTYDAIRQVIYESLRDPSLEDQVFETLKWLAYEKWDGQKRDLPVFECPHCHEVKATLPYDSDKGKCPNCGKELFLSDMLGFHQAMGEDSAPDNVASDYMSVQETLLVFTGIRYFWENSIETLKTALFVKDGPLSIRAQYSKLVNPIRRFFRSAQQKGVEICLIGQEKSGAFWEHLELIGDYAPANSFFVPDHKYIRTEIQHRTDDGAVYGKDTNYGAKVFVKLDDRHKFVLGIPNGNQSDPQDSHLFGSGRIFSTLGDILSARHESALLPVQMAHSIASLSTYPSAKVLALFAEATKKG